MIQCAVIGIGAISSAHIEGYLEHRQRCRIAALSDVNQARAEKAAADYGLDAAVFTDYRRILEDPSISLVSICTPPGMHCQVAVECLKAGKNVLLEKPMALSLEQCDRMLEEANRTGGILSVVSQYRYTGPYYRLKKLLESGKAGELLHISVDALFWRGQPYYYLDWRGRWKTEGGGCTLNHAVHFIDQLIWLAGMPRWVSAFMGDNYHTNAEVEDISEAIVQYENGVIGRITSSIIHHGEQQGVSLQTDRCGIGVPFSVSVSKSLENGFPKNDPASEETILTAFEEIPLPPYQGHAGQIHDVLNALEGKPSGYVTGIDGRNAVELVQAIYRAASEKAVVTLPIQSDNPFYTTEGMLPRVPVFHEKTISVQGFANNTIKVGGSDLVKK